MYPAASLPSHDSRRSLLGGSPLCDCGIRAAYRCKDCNLVFCKECAAEEEKTSFAEGKKKRERLLAERDEPYDDEHLSTTLNTRSIRDYENPRDRFRYWYPTFEQQVRHGRDLLLMIDSEHDKQSGCVYDQTPIGKVVYHGGKPLDDESNKNRFFYVSEERVSAADYGTVTAYRITKTYRTYSGIDDAIERTYGIELPVDANDEDMDDPGYASDDRNDARHQAMRVLVEYSNRNKVPIVMCSENEGNEMAFSPLAQDALVRIVDVPEVV
jgi:hypothetical protein